MHMKESIGKLIEAVDSLKDQTKDRDRKFEDMTKEIRDVGKDVHSAKVAGRTLLWVVGGLWVIFIVALGAYLQAEFAKRPIQEPPRPASSAPR